MPKWVTKEFLQACDERDHHLKCYRKNKTEENRNKMKRSRNHVTWLKQQLKQNYYRDALRKSRGNSKKLWSTINEAFGKKSKKLIFQR